MHAHTDCLDSRCYTQDLLLYVIVRPVHWCQVDVQQTRLECCMKTFLRFLGSCFLHTRCSLCLKHTPCVANAASMQGCHRFWRFGHDPHTHLLIKRRTCSSARFIPFFGMHLRCFNKCCKRKIVRLCFDAARRLCTCIFMWQI
jgi:hypothetical protein